MRHGNKVNKLGRTSSHRRALMANLTISLIAHKRITTTLAKAKALRTYAEPIITKAKTDNTHSRRTVFAYLRDKDSIKELFSTIAEKVANRPGGYTRILKLGTRMGDNAEMAMIELVDFNEYTEKIGKKEATGKAKTRRGRAKGGAAAPAIEATAVEVEGKVKTTKKTKKEAAPETTETETPGTTETSGETETPSEEPKAE